MQYPIGYKYDCMSYSMMNPNATCTVDLQTVYPSIGNFFREIAVTHNGLSLGFDRQGILFSDSGFITYMTLTYGLAFFSGIGFIGAGFPSLEFFDQANNYNIHNMTPINYTPTAFVTDATLLVLNSPTIVWGPGITENASLDWMDTATSYPSSYKFTVYARPFKTTPDMVNSNILN